MFGIGDMILPWDDMSQNRTNRTKNNCTMLPYGCNNLNVYSENSTNAPVSADDTSLCRMFAIWGLASKIFLPGSVPCFALPL